jgi:hypothetical protein
MFMISINIVSVVAALLYVAIADSFPGYLAIDAAGGNSDAFDARCQLYCLAVGGDCE